MKIDFTVPFRRMVTAPTFAIEPFREPQGRAPRIARLVARAHKLDAMARSGEIAGYSQMARLGHNLTSAPHSNHGAAASGAGHPGTHSVSLPSRCPVHHRLELRKIAREPRWDRQHALFQQFLQN
jgi:hypothetical protein